jgi:hypothetical protein
VLLEARSLGTYGNIDFHGSYWFWHNVGKWQG